MQSDFVPEKLKKAKWRLTKNLEISEDKLKEMEPELPRKKHHWWDSVTKYFDWGFLRLWW